MGLIGSLPPLVTCMMDSSTFPLNKWSLAFFFSLMLNDTAWTCFRTDDVRQLRYSSHVTFVCHTDKDTKYLFDPPSTVSVGGARHVQLPSIESV